MPPERMMSDDFSIDDDEGEMLLMGGETLLGKALVLRAGTAIVGVGIDGDAASWCEEPGNLYIFGVHKFYEVLHNDIHTILVEIASVAETEEVEFEALALNHLYMWDIGDSYLRKVGLAGYGTE